MTNGLESLERVRRDLAADDLWRRSLARSRERRARSATGETAWRSLVSTALADLDAPVVASARAAVGRSDRDLADPELWDLSLACAQARRRAAERGFLPQARVAGASLVVAAIAAATPAQMSGHSRSASTRTTRADVRLLKFGSRGADVARLQRALGISADGVFGPQTRAAVRAFQAGRGLLVDGIVGPQTRAALYAGGGRAGGGERLIRAWWVAPVQRALGVPADGVYGPITRAAVREFQARNGLVVDGIVGPQTLRALGVKGAGSGSGGTTSDSGGSGATSSTSSSRGARAAALAQRYLGIPYRWGGASPASGFDCSGFVMYVYGQLGVSLPHNAAMQYRYGTPVSRSELQPGDLVFFNGLGHNGIYVGGGRFVHSPHSGDVVKISGIYDSWYASRWVGGRRL